VSVAALDRSAAVIMKLSRAVVNAVSSAPPNRVWNLSGTNLTLLWAADHCGWRLPTQTNHLASGLSLDTNDWGTVSGSPTTNQITLPVNTSQPAGFYRLVFP
jgi:hypothetical protein